MTKEKEIEELKIEKCSPIEAFIIGKEIGQNFQKEKDLEMIEKFENDLIPMSKHPDAREEMNRIRFKVKELTQKIKEMK